MKLAHCGRLGRTVLSRRLLQYALSSPASDLHALLTLDALLGYRMQCDAQMEKK
eukprot:SAG31_NODE_2936_length_4892_cov_5.112456_5_plen_54_part_00